MKRVFFGILFICCNFLFAHPASKLMLTSEGTELEVIAFHSGSKSHFIYDVTVYLNEKVIIKQTLKTQTSAKTQTLNYTIPSLKADDVILVETLCNKGGTKKGELVIKEKKD